MSWKTVGLIETSGQWQTSEPFTGNVIRLRNLFSISQNDLPYGFKGLFAQAFNFPDSVELFDIRSIYPKENSKLYLVKNPFEDRPRRLAIKGQQKYETGIVWQVLIDVWTVTDSFNLGQINQSITDLSDALLKFEDRTNNNFDAVSSDLDNIKSNLSTGSIHQSQQTANNIALGGSTVGFGTTESNTNTFSPNFT